MIIINTKMSKIIVDSIGPNNNSNLNLEGNITVTGNLNAESVLSKENYFMNPIQIHIITYGANPPLGLSVSNFGQFKQRGVNKYEFGINFGSTSAVVPGAINPTDWSSLTGWVDDPYGTFGSAPGIDIQFRDAVAQFKPDYLLYPKGGMSLYWDWVNNDFVDAGDYINTFQNTLLPDEYNRLSNAYKEVRPAAHIDNFAAWFSSLKSVGGVGNRIYIYGNLYLETLVNTSNPNLADDSVKNQVLSYKNRADTLNVSYVELGHEYYLQGSDVPDVFSNGGGYATRFPNGSDYASAYLRYLENIRSSAQLNGVVCAANLCTEIGASNSNGVRRNNWNELFINEYFNNSIYTSNPVLHKLDAISIHGFFKIGLNSNAYTNFETWVLSAADQHYINLRTEIDNCKNLIINSNTNITPIMPKFWAIGYNLDDGQLTANNSNAISGCWGHGLFNLHYQFRLMSDPDIVLTAFHASHGGRAYGLFYTVTNGFGAGTTDVHDLTATGYIFKMLRDAEASTGKMRPLSIAGATQSGTQALGVYGMIFYRDLSKTVPARGTKIISILLMNISDTQRILDLSGIIDSTDIILYTKSAKADLRDRINEKINGVKKMPIENTVVNPPAASILTYTLDKYEVLHIAIGFNDELSLTP